MCDPISGLFSLFSASSAASATAATAAATADATAAAGAIGAAGAAAALPAIAAPVIADTTAVAGADAAATAGAGAGLFSGLNLARMFNIGSTIFNTVGAYERGVNERAYQNYQSEALTQNAKAKMAATSEQMAIESRDLDYTLSTQRARGAASGGGLDPSVMDIMGRTATQGATNMVNTLYSGQSGADAMLNQAAADRFQGGQAFLGGEIGAVTSLFSGMNKTMASKYGYDAYNPGYYSYG